MNSRSSTRRQRQAAATRRDILEASRRLFVQHGYAATSMASIAEEADTAIQTIYTSVGSKPAIVLALADFIDEEAGVGQMWKRMAEVTDPREMIALGVRLTRQLIERCGDIIDVQLASAATEPDVARAVQEGHQRHRGGIGRLVAKIEQSGALRPELSIERAADVFSVLTWYSTYDQFLRIHGWTHDACEAWLVETLTTLLLRPDDA